MDRLNTAVSIRSPFTFYSFYPDHNQLSFISSNAKFYFYQCLRGYISFCLIIVVRNCPRKSFLLIYEENELLTFILSFFSLRIFCSCHFHSFSQLVHSHTFVDLICMTVRTTEREREMYSIWIRFSLTWIQYFSASVRHHLLFWLFHFMENEEKKKGKKNNSIVHNASLFTCSWMHCTLCTVYV